MNPHPHSFRILQLAALLIMLGATAHARTPPALPDPSSIIQNPLAAPQPGVGGSPIPIDPGVFQPFVDGLLGKYGWLTTVLLAIGALRILFKPIMLVVENAMKNDPAKFAAVQKFEAGPVYKTIATVLDVGASIKLPLVKPPGPPAA